MGRETEEEKREEVEIREDESRKRDGRDTVPDERKAEDYRKRQRREGKIMQEGTISGSQAEAQERTSGSVGIGREKTFLLVCKRVSVLLGSELLSCYIFYVLLLIFNQVCCCK